MEQLEMQKTIAEIHGMFDNAQDKIVAEAIAIIKKDTKADLLKAERLERLGFAQAKPVKEQSSLRTEQCGAQLLLTEIEYCRMAYPTYKYITEKEIQYICAKYNLIFGDAYKYSGDIPEKNLAEIEAFKLKKEDATHVTVDFAARSFVDAFNQWMLPQAEPQTDFYYKSRRRQGHTAFNQQAINRQIGSIEQNMHMMDEYINTGIFNPLLGTNPVEKKELKKDQEYAKPAFKMVAPMSDFNINTANLDHMEGHKLINDPIVLCPIRSGYLIITKWGLEASDEVLLNEQHN